MAQVTVVDATAVNPNFSDRVEITGKALGVLSMRSTVPSVYRNPDVKIDVQANHEDFEKMMKKVEPQLGWAPPDVPDPSPPSDDGSSGSDAGGGNTSNTTNGPAHSASHDNWGR